MAYYHQTMGSKKRKKSKKSRRKSPQPKNTETKTLWSWLGVEKNHYRFLTIALLIAGGWAVFTYVFPTESEDKINSPSINGDGNIQTTIYDYGSPELAKKLGVTEAALKSFFKILERKEVSTEDLDSTLREIAKRYKELEQKLATFTSDDEEVVRLKKEASTALEAGDFERTEKLLQEAKQKDIDAAKTMQKETKKRLLSAAELGELKYTEFKYEESAKYYHEAAELVPKSEELARAKYLNLEGSLWHDAGKYREAQEALEHALKIHEKILGSDHPDTATTLNNLAELYRYQGRYDEAKPLLKRALKIRVETLDPHHLDIAQSLNNLALLY